MSRKTPFHSYMCLILLWLTSKLKISLKFIRFFHNLLLNQETINFYSIFSFTATRVSHGALYKLLFTSNRALHDCAQNKTVLENWLTLSSNLAPRLCSEKGFSLRNFNKWVLGENFNFFLVPGAITFTQYWAENETQNSQFFS